MSTAAAIFTHTPLWVYLLFFYLISRGMKALKPADVSLFKLAIVPALLTASGIHDLVRVYGPSSTSIAPWLGAACVGAFVGWLLIRTSAVEIDRTRGVIRRPPDYSVLPLVLLAFAVKYTFGVIGVVAPELLMDRGVWLLDLTVSGLVAGIFVGKFGCYAVRYFGAPATSSCMGLDDVSSTR
jgi:membrane protein CcdC involved in cytochrome C biogenesis